MNKTVSLPGKKIEDRLWEYVDKQFLGCWLWRKKLKQNGYGRIGIGGANCKTIPVHRVAYELLKGPIPTGMYLDHLCRVRHCVNPDHLEVVTKAENNRRGTGFSGVNHRKTHCPKGHALGDGNLVKSTKGRKCATCTRYLNKIYSAKRRANMGATRGQMDR